MLNVKALLIKLIFFFTCIALLIIVSILNSFMLISPTSYVINSALLVVSIAMSILCFIMHKRLINDGVKIIDIIISVVLFFLIYLIYLIPPFGFYGLLGVNNSIIILSVFTLGGMYLSEIANVMEQKNKTAKKPLGNTRQNKSRHPNVTIRIGFTGSLSGSLCSDGTMPDKVFKVLSLIILAVSFAAAIFNVIYPIIDMSMIIPR